MTKSHATSSRHNSGSTLLLAIGVLLLMLISCVGFLQVARLDRMATSRIEAGHVDQVTSAAIEQVRAALRDDLVDEYRVLFRSLKTETYDYPWTNQDAMNAGNRKDVRLISGANATAIGGFGDDAWLASTFPDFAANAKWSHISNLNGVFLQMPSVMGSSQTPREQPVDFSDWTHSDTNVLLEGSKSLNSEDDRAWQPLGVDADGDGINDSRWTWAPIRQIGGVAYVMAVRIIDNSSLLNANVALSQISESGAYDTSAYGLDVPRWWYPSELDLGGFLYSFGNDTYMTELRNMLGYRLGTDPKSVPMPLQWGFEYQQRGDFWINGPSLYGNFGGHPDGSRPYQAFDASNEIELRYRNGLNNPGFNATIETGDGAAFQGMPMTLRADTQEQTFTDVEGVESFADYYMKNPRLYMTVLNGSAIYAPRLKNDPRIVLKANINRLLRFGTKLSTQIRQILESRAPGGSGFKVPKIYQGWTVQEYADQLAANIIDYADEDNLVTRVNDRYGMEAVPFISETYVHHMYAITSAKETGNSDVWDVEWTPAGEPAYVVEIVNPFNRPVQLSNVWLSIGRKGWQLSHLTGQVVLGSNRRIYLYRNAGSGLPQEPNIVFSLGLSEQFTDQNGNGWWDEGEPFVDSDSGEWDNDRYDTRLVREEPFEDANQNGIKDLNETFTDSNGNGRWDPGDIIVQHTGEPYFDTNANAKWDSNEAFIDSNGNGSRDEIVNPFSANGRADMLHMHVTVAKTEKKMPYQRVMSRAITRPQRAYRQPAFQSAGSPMGTVGFKQCSTIGNANRINAMTVRTNEFLSVQHHGPSRLPALTHHAGGNALGHTDKRRYMRDELRLGDDQLPPADRVDANRNQIVISDLGSIVQIGELAQVPILGPDITMRIPDVWNGCTDEQGGVRAFMLDFAAPERIGQGNLGVSHATLFLDRFCTIDPTVDGLDNDGDGVADNLTEQLVPGMLNLNTAPPELLKVALPIPHPAVREKVVDAIVQYRESPTRGGEPFVDRNGNGRWDTGEPYLDRNENGAWDHGGLRGIAFMGECVSPFTAALKETDPVDTNALNGTAIDFRWDPSMTTLEPDQDGIADDREEEILITRWLSQVSTTRSDVFTAYILIRGYPADDFRMGPVEQRRLFVVFDRSTITTDRRDDVRILGAYEY